MKKQDYASNASRTVQAKNAVTTDAAVRVEHVLVQIFVPIISVSTVQPVFPNVMIRNAVIMSVEVRAVPALPKMYAATITA